MTQHTHRNARRAFSRRPLSLAVAAAMLALPAASVMAQSLSTELPRAGTVVGGSATISYNPGTVDIIPTNSSTTISQTTHGAIINWQTFSIDNGNTVNFTYSTPGGVTLNRVIGTGVPSLIAGAINATDGTVFIVNPAGVTFAGTAQVNVGGIVASALDISDIDFNTGAAGGNYVFTGTSTAGVAVQAGATLTAVRPDGSIALLGGGSVDNAGTLTAAGGAVGLAAGQSITLDPYGDGLTQFVINTPVSSGASVTNSGNITNNGGGITLAADDSMGATVNVTAGTLDAGAGGTIRLDSAGALSTGSGVALNTSGSTSRIVLTGDSGIVVQGTTINSGGGNINITGTNFASLDAVHILNSTVNAATGNLRVVGNAGQGTGVRVNNSSLTSNGLFVHGAASTNGVILDAAQLNGGTGTTEIIGSALSNALSNYGVALTNASTIQGQGLLSVSGWSELNNGIRTDTGTSITGNSTVVLRAGSAGSATTALQVDGTVSGNVINVRMAQPNNNLVEDGNAAMSLGGDFASIATLNNLLTPTLIAGHAGYGGRINVDNPITRSGNLTLQNSASDGIYLSAAINVGANTLALASDGDIVQTTNAPITARDLLVMAGGSAMLDSVANSVSSNTLAANVGSDFSFLNSNALSIGTVAATGINATGSTTSLSTSGVTAGADVFVQTQAGNLTLNNNVTGGTIDLVTAGVLNNSGSAVLNASNDWRVWASTWTGETRGGLLGSGTTPNLYGCAYTGNCTLSVSSGENHFIYAATPTLSVTIDNQTRTYGQANPALTYTLSGQVFADDIMPTLTLGTNATSTSPTGTYAITGTSSGMPASGYLMGSYSPGILAITAAQLIIAANNASKTYGQTISLNGSTVTGLVAGDTLFGGVTLTSDGTNASANVGSYAINPNIDTSLNSSLLSNYTIVYVDGALTINPALLRILAGNVNKTYGDTATLSNYTIEGLLGGDTVTSVNLASNGTTASANVGNYAIAASNANGHGLSNYSIQYLDGVLAIAPATLTYVADPLSILFGQPIGTQSGTVTGFRNGDTLGSATTGTLGFSTDAVLGSLPGDYAIIGGGLAAANYVFEQSLANYTALNIGVISLPTPMNYIMQSSGNYVYDLNFGKTGTCPVETPEGMRQESGGDALGREWARVRTRPNLMSCINSEHENGCGDF